MTQPSRLAFWRSILLVSGLLPFLAIRDLLRLAKELDVVVFRSTSWMGLIAFLGLISLSALLALSLTLRSFSGQAWSRARERILPLLERPAQTRWLGLFLAPFALLGYTVIFALPFARDLLGDLGWVRFLLFWFFSLSGMYGLQALKGSVEPGHLSDTTYDDFDEDQPADVADDQDATAWLTTLLLVVVLQTALHLLATQLSGITAYPFALGWSETSRYYYPSLFLSGKIFGERLPWPILHPSLHVLLLPPYLVNAPLWFHRFWQIFLRFALLGLTARTLRWRLPVKKQISRWLLWGWMVLYFFQGPVYFHLAVPLILMLWGYSTNNERRTWLFLILASVWSGLSRINWYPMPGILAAVLFLLEVPYQGKSFWRYLLKPALWVVIGFGAAFATQRAYIALSGIPDPDFFYTSLTSNLLWYRLFPNASYSVGVLPAALVASLPMWLVTLLALRQRRADLHPLRLWLIFAALLVLFAGGLVVSMKIGGGVDIHNLDAYLSLLLIVTAYIVLRAYTPENAETLEPFTIPWGVAALLVAVPAWFLAGSNVTFKSYDRVFTQAVIENLQAQVDEIDSRGGEILFITQRHLVSMHMLKNVRMVSEYEREELMEMAMGDNQEYLDIFRADMDKQRFAAIVVDPLSYRLLGKNYAFGEENNAWVRRVMKPILCNYQPDAVFLADQIAVYVPQPGTRQCP